MGEILAPVGNLEMARAAVHNGAHAIYAGAPGLNARGRTIDMTISELKELIEFCHLYDVKVFLAMNVLIFERELQAMEHYLREILSLGVDALIVQDIGLVKLIKTIAPKQVVHASTQMTISSAEAIHETSDLDLKRYVLSREMSLNEIQAVRENTEKELEVFVHGALCVSYSGQCLTSESFGGRSANRGQCAQSCRLDYELYVDDVKHNLGSKKYLFSPQDLCGIEEVSDLQNIGVDCFKIEGRLKSPEYVASTVKNFYQAMRDPHDFDRDEMASTYSRGLYPGWLHGVKHQELVNGTYSSNQGVLVGEVLDGFRNDKKGPVIVSSWKGELSPGDGVLFFHPQTGAKVGAKIYFLDGKAIGLGRDSDIRELRQIKKGWVIYRNGSPKIDASLQKTWKDKSNFKKLELHIELSAKLGQPLVAKAWVDPKNCVTHSSDFLLEPAQNKAWTSEDFQKALGSLGASPYTLSALQVSLQDSIFIHNKSMRKFKQELIQKLDHLRLARANPCKDVEVEFPVADLDFGDLTDEPLLNLLVRKEDQIDALDNLKISTIIMDFEFGKDYKPGLAKIHKLGYKAGIATLRVFKPGETHHLKVIQWLKPEVVLVRNLGALHWLKQNMDLSNTILMADYSLNITNSMTSAWMLSHNLSTLHPAHDCNKEQLFDLIQQVGSAPWEITLHHYMPTFHMEHCVFAGFLSNGNSVKDCGKPCEHHQVEVRDHKGAKHFLKSDQECRNTMFNGTPQSASKLIHELKDFGVRQFRIEALLEDSPTLATKVQAYSDLIHGLIQPDTLYQKLGVVEKYGVTEGQLFNNTPFQDRKKER